MTRPEPDYRAALLSYHVKALVFLEFTPFGSQGRIALLFFDPPVKP